MSVGIIMLVHTALGRAEQVARHWAASDCPIVIHVDRSVPSKTYSAFVEALSDVPKLRFCKRHRCEWGTWGLVAASQSASRVMLQEFSEVRHVYLASGSCLPLRPVQELLDYLAARPQTDFIESATTSDVPWTIGGLGASTAISLINMCSFSARSAFAGASRTGSCRIWARNGGA